VSDRQTHRLANVIDAILFLNYTGDGGHCGSSHEEVIAAIDEWSFRDQKADDEEVERARHLMRKLGLVFVERDLLEALKEAAARLVAMTAIRDTTPAMLNGEPNPDLKAAIDAVQFSMTVLDRALEAIGWEVLEQVRERQ